MLNADYSFSKEDLIILKKITEEYPWFLLGNQLLAKAAYRLNTDDYRQSLNRAALLAYSRERLFDFIMESIPTAAPSPSVEQPISSVASSKAADITKDSVDNQNSIEIAIKSDTLEKENQLIDESVKDTVEPRIKMEVAEVISISPIKNAEGEDIKSRDDLREIVKKELERIDKERAEAKNEAIKKTGELKKKPENENQVIKPKNEILDNFIKKSPSISRPADGPHDDTLRLAKESLEEHYDFVSETLAEIYFKQDNPEKAIKIYEQLILKLPEKKLYFAARIKEIVENK